MIATELEMPISEIFVIVTGGGAILRTGPSPDRKFCGDDANATPGTPQVGHCESCTRPPFLRANAIHYVLRFTRDAVVAAIQAGPTICANQQ